MPSRPYQQGAYQCVPARKLLSSGDVDNAKSVIAFRMNLYSPRNGSNTKNTAIHKHKYKQNESNDQVYQK